MQAYRCAYRDRLEAGKQLAAHLLEHAESPDAVVLALVRGGVPVAFELARILRLPLDVVVPDEEKESAARMYRSGRKPVDLENKLVILVDDGLTRQDVVRDAMENVSMMKPRRTIVAVPLASQSKCSHIESAADTVVCPLLVKGGDTPYICYEDQSEVTDDQVQSFMRSRV